MSRIISVALSVCISMAVAPAQEEPPKVVKINDSIYMATVTGNVYLVTTPAGNVIIDTAAEREAPEARKLLGAVSRMYSR